MRFKNMFALVLLLWPLAANAQNPPLLNMGYSGAGIGSDLLKVIERSGLWRKHGIDVRTVTEKHAGEYPGYHARYVLQSKVRLPVEGEI